MKKLLIPVNPLTDGGKPCIIYFCNEFVTFWGSLIMKQDLMHKDVHDVNITPEERRNIWQLWRQNLKDWVWYIRENPDWLDLDIQTAVKRHHCAPAQRPAAAAWSGPPEEAPGVSRVRKPPGPAAAVRLGQPAPDRRGPAGAVCPAPQAQHPPQRQHPGPAGSVCKKWFEMTFKIISHSFPGSKDSIALLQSFEF